MVEIFLKKYLKIGKLENWKIGKLENWKIGKLENWKIGKLEIDFKRKVKNANLNVGGYV